MDMFYFLKHGNTGVQWKRTKILIVAAFSTLEPWCILNHKQVICAGLTILQDTTLRHIIQRCLLDK